MWQFPWQYKESIAFAGGIAFIGFLLQLSVGPFDFFLMQYPVNIIAGVFLLLLPVFFSLGRKTALFQWFSGVPLAVTLIGSLLAFGLIMGLTPQLSRLNPHDTGIFTRLGFRQMTTAWPFVLLYLTTLLALGSLIVRRLIAFRRQDYAFYLNHTGVDITSFRGSGSCRYPALCNACA